MIFIILEISNFLKTNPNPAHYSLNKLKKKYNLSIITQNIDDLHERSGTKNVLHLHGKLRESKSILDNSIYPIEGTDLNLGDLCHYSLRPNVVWFGESVPKMDEINLVQYFYYYRYFFKCLSQLLIRESS